MDVNEQLLEVRQSVDDTLMDTFDTWREEYEEKLEKFDHFNSVFESW